MSGERDIEERVRRHLAAEAEELPFEVDGETVRRRLEQKQRGRWRSLALLPVAAAAVTLAVLAGQALVAGPGPIPSATSPIGDAWGPLAVVPPAQGYGAALAGGTLHITDACVFLEEAGGDPALLVWPADRTRWDGTARAIHFTNFDATEVTMGDGDRVTFGGGGDSTAEGGLPGAEWVERLEWVARPDASCPIDVRWSVGEVGEVVNSTAPSPSEFPRLSDPAHAAAVVLASDPLFAGLGPRRDYGTDPGSYYEARRLDTGFEVTMHLGWGDCMAGCIHGHEWRFAVSVDGDVGLVSEVGDPLDATGPDGYEPPSATESTVRLSGVMGAGQCPVTDVARPLCADGPISNARLIVRSAEGDVVAIAQTAPVSGRYRLPPIEPGVYLVEPRPVEGLTTPPLVAVSLTGGEAGLDFVYESAEPYRPGTLAEVVGSAVPVHRYVTDTDAPVITELASGTRVYLDEGPRVIGGREWFRVKPVEPVDWFWGYVSRLSSTGEEWLEIIDSLDPILADQACQPIEPRELPSGAPPGEIGLYATDGDWYATWGSGADEVVEAIGHTGSLDFPTPGAQEVVIRGTTGHLLPIGDPGQIAISWEADGCQYTIWVNGLSLAGAVEYANRF